jgi:hypothetical protein
MVYAAVIYVRAIRSVLVLMVPPLASVFATIGCKLLFVASSLAGDCSYPSVTA